MGRYSTGITVIEDCLIFSICNLRKWGALADSQMRRRTYRWSRGGKTTGEINYYISTHSETRKTLHFSYSWRKKAVKYDVQIIAKPTNLGIGVRWFFVCPHTGKNCLKLYCPPNNKKFLHRTAWVKLPYHSQHESKKEQMFRKSSFGLSCEIDRQAAKVYAKNAKTHYRGKPTPNMRKLNKLEYQKRNNPYNAMLRSYLSLGM